MILLEQQCVSLELVKRLKELGVKQESVWGWMQESVSKQYWLGLSDDKKTFEVASAFTVSELGEMLPECYITERRLRGDWEYSPHFTGTTQDVGTKEHTRNDVCMFADTEADARAKMLIYLVENKFVTL